MTASILELNDDCLVCICTHLDLTDQLRFAQTCQQFQTIYAVYFKAQHREIWLDKLQYEDDLNLCEYFQVVGPYIECIWNLPSDDIENEYILQLIRKYCKRLRAVSRQKIQIVKYQFYQHNVETIKMALSYEKIKEI